MGRVQGEGDLQLLGQVEGDITVSGQLHIAEGGIVAGQVSAGEIRVAGRLRGDATAQGSVAIAASGRVEGNIHAAELTLEEGGGLDGRIEADFELPDPMA